MLSLKNVKSPDSNFVNFPKVGAYGANPLQLAVGKFISNFLDAFLLLEYRKYFTKIWSVFLPFRSAATLHGLFCPAILHLFLTIASNR